MLKLTTVLLVGLLASAAASPVQAQDAQSQLWDAAIAGDTAGIVSALAAGASIDSLDTRRNRNGRRALNWAAFNNHGPAVRLLIARGAKLNLTNITGFTPVHHAAEAGALETLAILIEAGSDISLPNGQGLLPLDTARAREHTEAARMLEAAARKP